MTNSLHAANYKRIHIGIKSDFLVTIIMPVIFVILIILACVQLSTAGLDPNSDTISLKTLEEYGGFPIRLMYVYFIVKYALKALCALITISGLGEADAESGKLHISKLILCAFLLANAVLMLIRIINVTWNGDGESPLELTSLITRTVILSLHFPAIHFLLSGYLDIMNKIGANGQDKTAKFIRSVDISFLLMIGAYLFTVILTIFDVKAFLALVIMVIYLLTAVIIYLITQVRILKFTRRMILNIEEISK